MKDRFGLFLSLGIVIGIIVGVAIDKVPAGASMGMIIGLISGLFTKIVSKNEGIRILRVRGVTCTFVARTEIALRIMGGAFVVAGTFALALPGALGAVGRD